MGAIADIRDEGQALLEAAGMTVVLRLEELRPPCVWPLFYDHDHSLLSGGGLIRFRWHLVVEATDDERILEDLEDMLDTFTGAGLYPSENTTMVNIQVPENSQPFPAFQVTTSHTIG